jgi:hypothetical protein
MSEFVQSDAGQDCYSSAVTAPSWIVRTPRVFIAALIATAVTISVTPTVSAESKPSAPTNLRAIQLGTTGYPGPTVELRWSAPERGTPPITYRVYRDARLVETTTDLRSRITLLTKGVAYRFAVTAVTLDGESPPARIDVVAQMPPTMPLELQAVPGDGSVTLTWKPPVDSGGTPISGYDVFSSPRAPAPCVMTAPTSCVLTGLRNGRSYEFTVAARNAAWPQLDGQESDPAYATPGALPSGPVNFRQVATGSTSVMLAWERPAVQGDQPITGYQVSIFEDRGPNSPRELYAIRTGPADSLSMTVEGLTPGYEYYFGVRAITEMNVGAMTENVVVNPIGLPAAPERVYILGVGSGAVKVGWEEPDPNGGADPSEYRITATPNSGGSRVIVICRTAIPYEECTTDEIVTGLVNGVTYSFTVAAKNVFGYGPESTDPASATPIGPPQRSNE